MKMFHALFLGAAVVASLGLWGCTQQQTGAITTKIRELETRYVKLEEDYRALQANNDQNKKRLAQSESLRANLEEQKTELSKQLDSANEQRDDLRKQVALRTTERDSAQHNLMQFSKELMALAGRIEVAATGGSTNPHLTIVPVSRRSE